MSDEFAFLDATAQADLVRRGQVHPHELVDAAISRIERLDPVLNAVITPLFAQVRVQAASPTLPDGPFRGVPLLLKDFLCQTAGDPYYEGMRFLRDLDWRSEADTHLAIRFGPDDVEPHVWRRAEQGRTYSAVQIHAALHRLTAGAMRAPQWWASGFDLLITPTMQQPPPRIGTAPPERQGEIFGLFTMPCSVSGQPAISLPLHWSRDGLPFGVQLVAAYGREDVLIRVAAQLEAARPWSSRRPTFRPARGL